MLTAQNREIEETAQNDYARSRRCFVAAFFVTIIVLSISQCDALASITNTTGDVMVVPPPPSVVLGAFVGSVTVFQERQNFALPVSVSVDATEPGTYDQVADAVPGSLPAGTAVNSYLFHFDPVNPSGVFTSTLSSITFEYEILGVSFLKDTLNASHPILGSPTTTYSDNIGQLNLVPSADGADVFTISPDRRTTTFDLNTNAADVARIITAIPEPSALTLATFGFIGLIVWCWRRRKG